MIIKATSDYLILRGFFNEEVQQMLDGLLSAYTKEEALHLLLQLMKLPLSNTEVSAEDRSRLLMFYGHLHVFLEGLYDSCDARVQHLPDGFQIQELNNDW